MKEKYTYRIVLPVLLLGLLILFAANFSLAQESGLTYSQYMDNLTPLNPAYSLLDKAGSVSTLARKQLVGVAGAPETFIFNGNLPFENINGAAGFTAVDDQFAVEQQIEINAYFAKGVQLGENQYLGVSLNAGFRNYIANYSSLDSTDPQFKTDIRETKPNIGFGILYYSDKYYIGLSVPELTVTSLGTASQQNSLNFTNHYYLAGGLLATLDDDFKFKPATLISYTKGVPITADFSGTFYVKDILGIGVDYRTSNQVAGILSINVDGFHIGYSYEFNVASNDLGGFNIATNEVTLSYRFGKASATPKLL